MNHVTSHVTTIVRSGSRPLSLYHILLSPYLVPPTIAPLSSIVTVTEGTPHTLTCTATGQPLPLITWSHGGVILSTQGSLSIQPSVHRSDSGVYTCTATNTAGSDSVDITLDVLCM